MSSPESNPDLTLALGKSCLHHSAISGRSAGRQATAGTPLIFTTGGTGLTDDDITPEATQAVIDRDAPGFAEAMRAEAQRHTPMGILSRGTSGIAGRTLIINFPGSPKAIAEVFGVLAPTLGHVVQTLRGDSRHDGRG